MTDMTRKVEATMTEFEESVTFDADDPDFAPRNSEQTFMNDSKKYSDNEKLDELSRIMSATSVQSSSTENLNRKKSLSLTSCQNLDDSCGQEYFAEESHPQYQDTTILTIEELRVQLYSCFTCGVSWGEEHVSLDCRECGGYSLERPCPLCDGRCRNLWKRDLSVSHSIGKARWTGECGLSCGPALDESLVSAREKVRATS